MSRLSESHPSSQEPRPVDVRIEALASDVRREREAARAALVAAGREAVAVLLAAAADDRPRVRWEVTKALADIADARSVPALVERLDDPETGVRWIAAEGLIRMEYEALPALLAALESRSHSLHLREGAHHVIRELHVWKLVRMLSALQSALEKPSAAVSVPVAASSALDAVHNELAARRVTI